MINSSMAALMILILPCGYSGVEGINFTFNGFNGLSDVYVVPNVDINGGQWTYSPNDSSIYLKPSYFYNFVTAVAGRFLYPQLVQMVDPQTMTSKSFSCNIIFQIFIQNGNGGQTGSGMTFMMVPDNSTLGATLDYMGLLTTNTSETIKNYLSDNHTFGVEFDTHINPEFNDPNNNHIGIDLTSMNSTATFIPSFTLAQGSPNVYQQVWIDYFQAPDSRMDIYITQYGQVKPTTPFTKSVDLSFLNEYMYVGFSAAVGEESDNLHKVLAWSFSTDGPAPPIRIARDVIAPPAPSPPPPSPPPPKSPPPPPPSPSPPSPSPLSPPSPPPPGINEPAPSPTPKPVGLIIGSVFGGVCLLMSLLWIIIRITVHPIRFFLAHSETGKNFSEFLYKELRSTWRYKLNLIRVFFDKRSLETAQDFTVRIIRELNRTQVGVVIITENFFEKKWPMTELLSFVDSKIKYKNRMGILPLFYRLSVVEVRRRLRAGTWDATWRKLSTEAHPLNVDACRAAVEFLCNQTGVEYNAKDENDDLRYMEEILKEVVKISNKMRKQPHLRLQVNS